MTEPTPATIQRPVSGVPSSVSVNGWAMWLFVFLPLIDKAIYAGGTVIAFAVLRSGGGSVLADAVTSPSYSLGITALSYVVGVLLLVADWRRLVRIGVPNPLRWQWGFLHTVYLIARGVVLHRRLGRGMAATWIGLATFLGSLVWSVSGGFHAFLLFLVS